MKTRHVYIHFPFCISKCPYCDFFSIPFNDRSIHDKYIDYLLKEIENYGSVIYNDLETLYLGGGTPSLIEPAELSKILTKFSFKKDAEITIEVNPATADLEKLRTYRELGINRLSIGSQSFINGDLKTLGRKHSAEDIYECFENSRKAGFENINLDLIIGIPGQSAASVIYNVNELTALGPEHVSAYILTFYEKTPFTKKLENGTLTKLEDDTEMEFFELTSEILEKHGLNRYEISNFSKSGKQSRHNMNTWNFGNYLGLGASAHSFMNGRRWENPGSVENWYYSVVNRFSGHKESPETDPDLLKKEFVMLGLRKTEGMSIESYNKYFKSDFFKEFEKKLDQFFLNKTVYASDGKLKLNPDRFSIFNSIVSDIIF